MTLPALRAFQGLIGVAALPVTSFPKAFVLGAVLVPSAAFAFALSAVAQGGTPPVLQRINRDRLCVTNGRVAESSEGRLAVETPSSRAVLQEGSEGAADQIAEIHFQYLGPSQDSRPLASGELRRQIGLKLRAGDSCNVIYAMWRIEPVAGLAVSLKRNGGLHTHQQCGARGYVNFKSQDRGDLPPIRPGDTHRLRAELRGNDLTVTADGKLAWQGPLASAMALPIGPPGFRTDNARFAFEYFAAAAAQSGGSAQHAPAGREQCVMSQRD